MLAPAATVVGLALLLLLPALYNGYPVLFADTADYLLRSQSLAPSPIRASGYSVWIRLTGGGLTLWLPVVAQSLLLAALIWRTLRLFGNPRGVTILGAGAALVLGTSVAWASSKAMPDIFIAMLILGLYLVAVHWEQLGVAARTMASASVIIGGTMHLTNLLVGAAALGAIALLQQWTARPVGPRRARVGAALLLVVSAGLTRGYDYARRDDAAPRWNGSMFILSHLVETGLAQKLLQERCGTESFALCPVRDTLTRSVETFVWRPEQGPRNRVLRDDPQLIRAETNHILGGIIRRHPLAFGWSIIGYTAEQLVTFRVNDDIWRHEHRTHVQRAIAQVFPRDLPAQERARQQSNTLRLSWSTMVHLIVFLAAAAFSIITLRRMVAAKVLSVTGTAALHVVVWVALVVNAALCANLASVFSRYQSRVSWLLPLAVLATAIERGALRWPVRRPYPATT